MAADHIIDFLGPEPGIQRDGTQFDTRRCIDGQWVRFYKGRPKKIGGSVLIDPGNLEIIRNIYNVDQQNEVFLQQADPKEYGALKKVLIEQAKKIKREQGN